MIAALENPSTMTAKPSSREAAGPAQSGAAGYGSRQPAQASAISSGRGGSVRDNSAIGCGTSKQGEARWEVALVGRRLAEITNAALGRRTPSAAELLKMRGTTNAGEQSRGRPR